MQRGRRDGKGVSTTPEALTTLRETERHRVEVEATLPSAIKAHMGSLFSNFLDTDVSACVDKSTYAWVVIESTLYLWKYKEDKIPSIFTLPQSRHAYDAKLVQLVGHKHKGPSGEGKGPGLLVCSRQGHVTYWPDIAKQSAHLTSELPLISNSECTVLADAKLHGFVIGTSQGILYHLTVANSISQRDSLDIFTIPPPTARSRFAFWKQQDSKPTAPIMAIVTQKSSPTLRNPQSIYVHVLTKVSLQTWLFVLGGKKELVRERTVLEVVSQLDTEAVYHFQDFKKSSPYTLSILVVCSVVHALKDYLHYIIISVPTGNSGELISCGSEFQPPVTLPDEKALLERHRVGLEVPHKGSAAFVHWPSVLAMMSIPKDDEVDFAELPEVLIIGSGVCSASPELNKAMYICARYGIISVIQQGSKALRQNLVGENATAHIPLDAEARKQHILAAFYKYGTGVHPQQAVLREIIQDKTKLAEAVVGAGATILDGLPDSDPTWAEDEAQGREASQSMILRHRMEEKNQKYALFLAFLHETQLWQNLSSTHQGVLFGFAERIKAALHLREHRNSLLLLDPSARSNAIAREVLARATMQTLASWNISQEPTMIDYFYSVISRIAEILPQAQQIQINHNLSTESVATSTASVVNSAFVAKEVNCIFEAVLRGAVDERRSNSTMRNYPTTLKRIPWTSEASLRECLYKQITETHKVLENLYLIPDHELGQETAELMESQLYSFVDIILDGYSEELACHEASMDIPQTENRTRENVDGSLSALRSRFSSLRNQLLMHFLDLAGKDPRPDWQLVAFRAREHATLLAEHYGAYSILIVLCDQAGPESDHRLRLYQKRFGPPFTQTLLRYYYENDKQKKLLTIPEEYKAELAKFLEPYPEYAWLHALRYSDYHTAAGAAYELGLSPTSSLFARKTLLSISKLAYLASEQQVETWAGMTGSTFASAIDQHLYLTNAQSRLQSGANMEDPPMSAGAMIGSLLTHRTLTDVAPFLHALDLYKHSTMLRSDLDGAQLLQKIWQDALESEDWDKLLQTDHQTSDKELESAICTSILFHVVGAHKDIFSPERLRALIANTTKSRPELLPLLKTLGAMAHARQ